MQMRIFVIGLGLIGGSLALSIKNGHPQATVVGYDSDQDAMSLAKSLQIIDEPAASIEDAAISSDVIIIATPVTGGLAILERLIGLPLKEGAIITDVGSTKKSVVDKGKELSRQGVSFIGGHPMAGSHKTGIEASNDRLFENAFYIFSPVEGVPSSERIRLQNILKGTRAKFLELNPADHDRFAGLISHLPHILASSLVNQVAEKEVQDPLITQLAAGGFRDLTRIASASPEMWRDILLQNREVLLDLLKEWQSQLTGVEKMIDEADEEAIFTFFQQAKTARDQLPSRKKGAMLPFYDLFVDVPDHPGVISDVTAILADAGISITNIRIIEAREDIMGVLRLSFRSAEDLQMAKDKLREHFYETYDAP
ncbi:prephenate dehydrogenase [Salisediminibacterium halotolerans]|uniref:Prephenate dehydrogenase n=1 Tax=Salisediminibacterium halotolerans TaxID=517425 RepID=A0A1H9P220_9BACI|nr:MULTISPECIES: prephenate dehydrogenase [Salisediminibacterium]RLJ77932.1 prephenate dehydrogenase [Actinophytocola xinjiangensis]RPE88730.1 prephenate dehydrogenase [Salisediminibacterium halotolerans]TWG36909.1 prephenate dehydrogenase [Salisediminibacterium halotolerans]SER42117.1 prephenate dehydrogenase [Salisediminibacterium haloalkalitolerans]GEL07405.1 prephenate dehydrogenase [Salisediminibacterium halotolerans]